MTTALVFNKWDTTGITVVDPGLQRYLSVEARIVPKTGARYAGKRFHKSKTFIVERLINKLMVSGHKSDKHYRSSGHFTGQAATAHDKVKKAFLIVEQKTKTNPIKAFVQAIENAATREEIVTVEYGGARYPKATECSPQRRIDMVLRHFVQGALNASFNKKKSIEDSLADEIVAAYQSDQRSTAISKKLELERQADASR